MWISLFKMFAPPVLVKLMDKLTLWNAVLTELQLSLSSANFQTWFKGKTEITRFESPQLEIGCNSSYTKDWLEQRYHGQLKAIVDRLLGEKVTLTFIVSTNLKNLTKPKSKGSTDTPLFGEDADKLAAKLAASNLNSKYTFDSFVVGNSNQLAFAVAQAVASSPAKAYNPLFIYGGVGLGKTHLIQAVGHAAIAASARVKVLYCTSEAFTNEMIEAIQSRRMGQFRTKYRGVDILIIDDIQFIAGRETTQEEFFHTFNDLYASGKQIILSSDRQPNAISKLEERLRSRFEGGMIADIQPPDVDLREAILLSKVRRLDITISAEVIRYLARSVTSSIRDLEGSLVRLSTQGQLNGTSLSIELAKSFIDERYNRQLSGKVTPKEVLDIVCEYFKLRQTDLRSSSRIAKMVLPRQITMYLLRKDLGLQLEYIAEFLGKKDHTTVMHGVEKIEGHVENSDKLRGLVEDIRAKLYN